MKTRIVIFSLLLVMLLFAGCYSHTHIVGRGAQSNQIMQARQWYILFGIVPLNFVDSQAMASGTSDYTIHTASTPPDFFINIFTSIITVQSRTVTVVR
ncbi:MAG: Bor/Iss family lipoprotein [Candidatus Zixiibacteriota bacterium]